MNRSVSVAFAALAFMGSGQAAASVPLSAIPLSPDTLLPAREDLQLTDVHIVPEPGAYGSLVTAMDRPVCLRSADPADPWRSGLLFPTGPTERFVIERLIPGDAPVLDRVLVDGSASFPRARVTGHVRVPLAEIAREGDIAVYAYRSAKAVHFFVPRGFNDPRDGFDGDGRVDGRFQCGFVSADLDLPNGSLVTSLTGPRPMREDERWISDMSAVTTPRVARSTDAPPAPAFVVNLSVSRVSRDPEPLVSVMLRVVPREVP